MKTFCIEEAADFLRVSTDTLGDMAATGVVPAAKIGRSWIFTDEHLESYVRDEVVKQTSLRRGISQEGTRRPKAPSAHGRTSGKRRPMVPPPLTSLPHFVGQS